VQDRHILRPVARKVVFDHRDEGGVRLDGEDVFGRRPPRADRGDIADARAQFEHAEPLLHATLRRVRLIRLVTAVAQPLRDQRRRHGRRQVDLHAVDLVSSPVTPAPRWARGPQPSASPDGRKEDLSRAHRGGVGRQRLRPRLEIEDPRNPALRKPAAQGFGTDRAIRSCCGKLRDMSQSVSQKPRTVAPLKIIVPGLSVTGSIASAP
jgi:hypothetical protein